MICNARRESHSLDKNYTTLPAKTCQAKTDDHRLDYLVVNVLPAPVDIHTMYVHVDDST